MEVYFQPPPNDSICQLSKRFIYFLIYVYECYTCIYVGKSHVSHVGACLRSEKSIRFPGTGVTEGCDLPCR